MSPRAAAEVAEVPTVQTAQERLEALAAIAANGGHVDPAEFAAADAAVLLAGLREDYERAAAVKAAGEELAVKRAEAATASHEELTRGALAVTEAALRAEQAIQELVTHIDAQAGLVAEVRRRQDALALAASPAEAAEQGIEFDHQNHPVDNHRGLSAVVVQGETFAAVPPGEWVAELVRAADRTGALVLSRTRATLGRLLPRETVSRIPENPWSAPAF